jgi:hypothetical protein
VEVEVEVEVGMMNRRRCLAMGMRGWRLVVDSSLEKE